MKTVRLSVVLIGLLLSQACDSPVSFSPNSQSTADSDLIVKILYDGDTAAYNALYDKYADDGAADRCLAYAIVMANKYNYAPASYHVYEILTGLYASPPPSSSDDPDMAELKSAARDIDSAIAVVRVMDPVLDSALCTIDRGLDYLDPETRHMALSYYGRSLF